MLESFIGIEQKVMKLVMKIGTVIMLLKTKKNLRTNES
jgi:hypothetical protein